MAIVQASDFQGKGEYRIAQNCFSDFAPYIEKYEKKYLLQLLGAELYGLFIADLTPTTPQIPQTARFIQIFDPFDIDDNECVYSSEGIKAMLIQFIYFHIMRDNPNIKTVSGTVRMQNENSSDPIFNGFNLVESYNKGTRNAFKIQWYIDDNRATYPEENMQIFEYLFSV